jgi:ribosomal protein L13
MRQGKTVGRLATEVARILSGKNNPAYTPFLDMGDHVIVINARQAFSKARKTSRKFIAITRFIRADFAKRGQRYVRQPNRNALSNWRSKECFRKPNSAKRWRKN